MTSAALSGRPTPFFKIENTYKLEPDKPFSPSAVSKVIKGIFEEELKNKFYEPAQCNLLSAQLADLIKKGVKDLGFSRYKLVTMVAVGEPKSASVAFTSRCIWNDKVDNYSEFVYNGDNIYAVGLVYGIYSE
ncbi:hypothetical protein LOTGIDRAFT_111691 [Lottia gigantea]|uniref:Uncharacterized protein n=1 Tax=Lottia gigantea TaxID=225164 RepID=V4B1Q6_LOTGI|nr:hypothetical protein LOTGIDRAFT_111691 [Lottia gigantea]ESP01256.1 hypothetical protein LOTGIDRAFT_111691 [Lottia gigantea]